MSGIMEIILASVWDVRIGIPVALLNGVKPFWALFLVTLCGLSTVIPALALTKHTFKKEGAFVSPLRNRLYRATRRHRATIDRYAYLGVFLLVALPLPGTGPWMGMLAVALLEMEFVRASMALALGIIVTASITLGITEGILSLIPLLG